MPIGFLNPALVRGVLNLLVPIIRTFSGAGAGPEASRCHVARVEKGKGWRLGRHYIMSNWVVRVCCVLTKRHIC